MILSDHVPLVISFVLFWYEDCSVSRHYHLIILTSTWLSAVWAFTIAYKTCWCVGVGVDMISCSHPQVYAASIRTHRCRVGVGASEKGLRVNLCAALWCSHLRDVSWILWSDGWTRFRFGDGKFWTGVLAWVKGIGSHEISGSPFPWPACFGSRL